VNQSNVRVVLFHQAVEFGEVESVPLSDSASQEVEDLVEVFDTADGLNCVEVSFRCSLCYRGFGKFQGNISDELFVLIFRFDDSKTDQNRG